MPCLWLSAFHLQLWFHGVLKCIAGNDHCFEENLSPTVLHIWPPPVPKCIQQREEYSGVKYECPGRFLEGVMRAEPDLAETEDTVIALERRQLHKGEAAQLHKQLEQFGESVMFKYSGIIAAATPRVIRTVIQERAKDVESTFCFDITAPFDNQ